MNCSVLHGEFIWIRAGLLDFLACSKRIKTLVENIQTTYARVMNVARLFKLLFELPCFGGHRWTSLLKPKRKFSIPRRLLSTCNVKKFSIFSYLESISLISLQSANQPHRQYVTVFIRGCKKLFSSDIKIPLKTVNLSTLNADFILLIFFPFQYTIDYRRLSMPKT